MSTNKRQHHIEVEKPDTSIVDIVCNAESLSRVQAKRVMHKGAVWLTKDSYTQRVRRVDKRLEVGNSVHIYYDESVLDIKPNPAALITDKTSYSIWYKPYGMLSQGSKWGDHCTLGRWVETHIEPQRPAFIVHRLDRAASGLMLIAHSKKIAAALSDQFQTRKVEKHYRALVKGNIETPITFDQDIDAQSALTHVAPIMHSNNTDTSLLEVDIKTGRKHQIRKHLSQANFPILGDRLYDPNVRDEDPDLCLVACFLAFDCPLSQERRVFHLPESLTPSFASVSTLHSSNE